MARLRWLPNAITTARLAALPVLAATVARAPGPTSQRSGWLFGAIGATDLLDGWLARRMKAQSAYGKVVDPLADRMLVAVGLLGLIRLGRMPWPGPAAILVRDMAGMAGFAWFTRRGVRLEVDMPGKVASTAVMCGTGLAMLTRSRSADALFWLGVGLSLATLANYARTVASLGEGAEQPPSTSG
jgi:CDP-diacylglycerol--glycerol-3-phosphate 3-phosphatidyltransferase